MMKIEKIDERTYKVGEAFVYWNDGRARCVDCSGPLVAMSASCGHARALKRYMAKPKQESKIIFPRPGDRWKFRPARGKRHTTIKTIDCIIWLFDDKRGGKRVPYVKFKHTPKARYIGMMQVRVFLNQRRAKRVWKYKPIDIMTRK